MFLHLTDSTPPSPCPLSLFSALYFPLVPPALPLMIRVMPEKQGVPPVPFTTHYAAYTQTRTTSSTQEDPDTDNQLLTQSSNQTTSKTNKQKKRVQMPFHKSGKTFFKQLSNYLAEQSKGTRLPSCPKQCPTDPDLSHTSASPEECVRCCTVVSHCLPTPAAPRLGLYSRHTLIRRQEKADNTNIRHVAAQIRARLFSPHHIWACSPLLAL